MISDDLLNKFDNIEDLPVSEEMLGAYMENNLSPSECYEVESVIQDNDYLEELVNSNIDIEYGTEMDDPSIDINLDSIELPIIPDDSFIGLDLSHSTIFCNMEYSGDVAAFVFDGEYYNDDSNIDDNSIDNNIDNTFEDDDLFFDSSDDNNDLDYE